MSAYCAGIASCVISTVQQAGSAFGVAVVGLVSFTAVEAMQAGSASVAEAYTVAFAITLIFNVVAVTVMTALAGSDGSQIIAAHSARSLPACGARWGRGRISLPPTRSALGRTLDPNLARQAKGSSQNPFIIFPPFASRR